jgi:hypothetical protein
LSFKPNDKQIALLTVLPLVGPQALSADPGHLTGEVMSDRQPPINVSWSRRCADASIPVVGQLAAEARYRNNEAF